MTDFKPFSPKKVSSPADTINELIETAGWTHTEFAERMGHSMKHIHELLHGHQGISAPMALKLETVLGGSASFWLNRDSRYQEFLARQKEENAREAEGNWLKQIRATELVQRKWVEASDSVAELVGRCLRFFGVSSVDAWTETYRGPVSSLAAFKGTALVAHVGPTAAWLRRGEVIAETIKTAPWDPQILKSLLPKMRALTTERPDLALERLQAYCATAGVALVALRAPTGCPVNGATRFLSKEKALIMLSFFGRNEDRIWFTFFHEIGHLLLHGKKLVFVDLNDHGDERQEQENQANDFARDLLIPRGRQKELEQIDSHPEIVQFASELGISPAIVVGQVRRRTKSYGAHHTLVRMCPKEVVAKFN